MTVYCEMEAIKRRAFAATKDDAIGNEIKIHCDCHAWAERSSRPAHKRACSQSHGVCVSQSWVNCSVGLFVEELIWCFGYTCYATIYKFHADVRAIDVIAARCLRPAALKRETLSLFERDPPCSFDYFDWGCILHMLYVGIVQRNIQTEAGVFAGRNENKKSTRNTYQVDLTGTAKRIMQSARNHLFPLSPPHHSRLLESTSRLHPQMARPRCSCSEQYFIIFFFSKTI